MKNIFQLFYKNILVINAIFIALSLQSCYTSLQIEKSTEVQNIKKIAIVSCNYNIIDSRNSFLNEYKFMPEMEAGFKEAIIKNSNKNNITIEFTDDDNILISEDIAALKKDIIHAASYQSELTPEYKRKTGLNTGFIKPKGLKKQINPIRILSQYSYLSKKYQTPFISVQGILSVIKTNRGDLGYLLVLPPLGIASFFKPDYNTYYYNFIANVLTGEIVYKEYRKIFVKPKINNLEPILYDSYRIISGI